MMCEYEECRKKALQRVNSLEYLSLDNLEGEIWAEIPFNDNYLISNKGRVKSLSRIVSNGVRSYLSEEAILKPNVTTKGYLQVQIRHDGKIHQKFVHRLVAIAFLPNEFNYPQINHKNCDKSDNRVENIEWCNNSQNQRHAWGSGLRIVTGKSGRPKKKIVQLTQKGEFVREWNSIKECATAFGDKNLIGLINVLKKRPHSNTYHGYKFEYYELYK